MVVFKIPFQRLTVSIKKNQNGMLSSWRKIIFNFGCINNWKILAYKIMKSYHSADILEKGGAPKQCLCVCVCVYNVRQDNFGRSNMCQDNVLEGRCVPQLCLVA